MIVITVVGGRLDGSTSYHSPTTNPNQLLPELVAHGAVDWTFWFCPTISSKIRRHWWDANLACRVDRALRAQRPIIFRDTVYQGEQSLAAIDGALTKSGCCGRILADTPQGLWIITVWRVEEDLIGDT
jgi:hypothetical protein